MRKIIAVASHKGGVGKTTTALNLGYGLKMLGHNVLILDGDPQGGLAVACNLKAQNMPGMVQVLRGEAAAADILVHWQDDGITLAGSGIDDPDEISFFEEEAEEGRLAALIWELAEGFDFVIIDAPVGMGRVVRALLAASDSYITVLNCRAYTIKSVARFFKLSQWLRDKVNPGLNFEGALVTMYDEKSEGENRILDHLHAKLPANTFFSTRIPYDISYENAGIRSLPLVLLEGKAEAARPYRELAVELISRLSGEERVPVAADDGLDIDLPEGEGFSKDRSLEKILAKLCNQCNYCGAVIGDERGFAIAEYKSPMASDLLAAFASELGEVFAKTGDILELKQVNNISIEITDAEKLLLHWFTADDKRYYLLVVCPQETEDKGELDKVAGKIRDTLQ